MYSVILFVIYLSFIALGLPDSLLGNSWQVMYLDINAPFELAGAVSMIITAGTVISALFSPKLTLKLGTGRVNLISIFISSLSLALFSVVRDPVSLCLVAVPYGLSAGAVDSALNNYVATHFSSRHMNWLHCFWGVGACISPYIMFMALGYFGSWRLGYAVVAVLTLLVCAAVLFTLSKWDDGDRAQVSPDSSGSLLKALRIKGIWLSLGVFFCYCAFETTAGLWIASYLGRVHGISEDLCSALAGFFYVGITLSRLVCGFVSDRLGDKRITLIGSGVMLLGSFMFLFSQPWLFVTALAVTGFGGSPLYPCLVHSAEENFGSSCSAAVTGLQMAFAYVGSTLSPFLFKLLLPVDALGVWLFVLCVLCFACTVLLWNKERLRFT